MRKVRAGLFISLDGVAESPSKWAYRHFDDEAMGAINEGLPRADAILLGRRTYLEFAELWPGREGPMADFLNNTPKHVVSSTLQELEWGPARLVTGGLAEEVAELKRQPGKDIQVPGSPRLVASLLREGLLDELSLMIAPAVVGSGGRLFDEIGGRIALELVDSRALGSVLSLTYRTVLDRSHPESPR
jgi:dihydrofolate reductase